MKVKKFYLKQLSPEFWGINYEYSSLLDNMFIPCIESGIETAILGDYTADIKFNNGVSVEQLWTENKWYAWLHSGIFKSPNGKKVTWSSSMPSARVRIAFDKVLKDFIQKEEKRKLETFMNY